MLQRRGTSVETSVLRRRKGAIRFALGTAGIAIAALGLALAQPADARQKKPKKEALPPVVDIDNGEPMMIVVSLGDQKVDVYRGTDLVTTSEVSTGTKAHPTMVGSFSILEKKRWHHSNLYSNAPMPYMNRITWSGTALHAGVLPGYPASHGCIRLRYSFAPQLFKLTTVGDNVVISRGRPVPTLVEHPALFQPAPLPTVASLPEPGPLPTGGPSPLPAMAAAATVATPVILAKAETTADANNDEEAPAQSAPPEPESQPDTGRHDNGGYDPDPERAHAVTKVEDITGSIPAQPIQAAAPVVSPPAAKVDSGTGAASLRAAAKVDSGAGAASLRAAAMEAAAKLDSGVEAAAVLAAKPRSAAPLRMLVTRATQRDRIIGMQEVLASMGYLPKMKFDGTLGKATIGAIKAFQKDNGLRVTGAFKDELVKQVYAKAGKGEPPAGHLFVRQEFEELFTAPVSFRNPQDPLGTHVYTALKFAPDASQARWVALDVENGKVPSPLDRLQIPEDVRRKVSERLTPGSTFIVAERALNSAGLPKGGDFIVLTKDSPSPSVGEAGRVKPKVRRPFGPDYYAPFERRNFQPFWGRGGGGLFGIW